MIGAGLRGEARRPHAPGRDGLQQTGWISSDKGSRETTDNTNHWSGDSTDDMTIGQWLVRKRSWASSFKSSQSLSIGRFGCAYNHGEQSLTALPRQHFKGPSPAQKPQLASQSPILMGQLLELVCDLSQRTYIHPQVPAAAGGSAEWKNMLAGVPIGS